MNSTSTLHPTQTADDRTTSRRSRTQLLVGVSVLALVGALLAGCSTRDNLGSERVSSTIPVDGSLIPVTDVVIEAAGESGPAGGNQSNGDNQSGAGQTSGAGGQSSGSGQPSTGQPSGGGQSSGAGQPGGSGQSSGPAPVINNFTTPENIDCHNGNFKMFTAKWTTTNAVKTTISIDGPGIYDTYGPNAEVSLPFNCSSAHTFLLTAYAEDGKTATKSITLQPRNVQKPQAPDEEE
jgi:hypothetical protein